MDTIPAFANHAPTRTTVSFLCLANRNRCSETGAVISPTVTTARLKATRKV